jgi:hypothetical protein
MREVTIIIDRAGLQGRDEIAPAVRPGVNVSIKGLRSEGSE